MSAPAIRIGHKEREAAARALDEHLTEGRLDADEYADRYAKSTVARFQGDLDELFLDLPLPHAGPAATAAVSLAKKGTPARHYGGLIAAARVLALLAVVAVAVPLFTAWWLLWFVVPMLFWGGNGHCGAWKRQRFSSRW